LYPSFLPNGWRPVQIVRQRRKKMTITAPTTLSAIQAAIQSSVNSEGHLKKFNKPSANAYSGLDVSIYVIKIPIQLVRQSLTHFRTHCAASPTRTGRKNWKISRIKLNLLFTSPGRSDKKVY
jgi:hypothetical protein